MNENYYSNIYQIKCYLADKYEFRFNTVLDRTEYRNKGNENEVFIPMQDYEFNTLMISMNESHISCGVEKLKNLLKSDFVEKYNPFHSYFNNLPKWDGLDYIGQLAATMDIVDNTNFFQSAIRKWLVATVASLMDEKIVNQTILVFTGKQQGIGKTTWIRRLIPEELKEYYYEGIINPNNKDDKIQLTENMLINVDELGSLKNNELELLKSLITNAGIKLRRVYGRHNETFIRRASFAGSLNNKEFLSDTTGNRRFLCFEVKKVDYTHEVPMDRVYSQALHLYKTGFQYWFNMDEIAEINSINVDFSLNSVEEDLVLSHLTPSSKEEGIFGTTTDIMNLLLTLNSSDILKNTNKVFINVVQLGKILNKHGFLKGKQKSRSGYYYKQKELSYGYADD